MSNRPGLTGAPDDAGAPTTDALAPAAAHHPHPQYFYLPKKLWSPRYELDFYSVTITGHRVFESPPPSTTASSSDPAFASSSAVNPMFDITGSGSRHHPAVYYEVTVHRARKTSVVWRRYSHFVWLKRQWAKSPPSSLAIDAHHEHPQSAIAAPAPTFPSPCPFFWWLLPHEHREAFLQQRQHELTEYLDQMLGSPGYPSHPATVAFLELRQ